MDSMSKCTLVHVHHYTYNLNNLVCSFLKISINLTALTCMYFTAYKSCLLAVFYLRLKLYLGYPSYEQISHTCTASLWIQAQRQQSQTKAFDYQSRENDSFLFCYRKQYSYRDGTWVTWSLVGPEPKLPGWNLFLCDFSSVVLIFIYIFKEST